MKDVLTRTLLFAMLCLAGLWLPGWAGTVLNDAMPSKPFRHQVWQDVLVQFINNQGDVDFGKLRARPKRLNDYLTQLELVSPENRPDFFPTSNDKTAYWINAHNAIALRIILDHYPVQSLDKIPHWDQNARYSLGGRLYSLSQLKLKALSNPELSDILFSLTDYSLDAPPIWPNAYEGRRLQETLQQARQASLASGQLLAFERKTPQCVGVQLSAFFRQYEESLFKPPAYATHDRDLFASPDAFTQSVSYTGPLNWMEFIKAYAPAAVHADLSRTCGQPIQFKPANKTLRQVRVP